MPLDRRGRPPAEPRQSSIRRRLARDVEVEYVEHGLDWLAERVEPADEEETVRLPEPVPGHTGQAAPADDEPEASRVQEPAPGPPGHPEPVPVPEASRDVPAPPPAAPAAEVTTSWKDGDADGQDTPRAPSRRRARPGAGPGGDPDGQDTATAPEGAPEAAVPLEGGMPGPEVEPEAASSVEPEAASSLYGPAPGEASAASEGPEPAGSADQVAWAEPEPARPADEDGQPAGGGGPEDPHLPGWDDLTSERLLARQPGGPTAGWQGFVFRLTGGRVRPRPGRAERARRELEARVTAPIHGYRRIAVLALKGGVGKTTTTACLGATFAIHRPDRVVAVDASPDAGTLGGRTRGDGTRTAKDLLAGAPPLDRYADVRAYAAQTTSGLEVVASEMDPSMSHPFSDADYRKVAAVLERFYSLILTDCGPGVLHTVMLAVLERADQIVVVSAPSVDGAQSAALTLDWLEQHGFEALARSAVVVVNSVRPRGPVSVGQLEEHFSRRCRAVVRVPFDRHLETGAEIEFDQLAPGTRHAYVRLAAAVADGFDDQVRAHWERVPPPA